MAKELSLRPRGGMGEHLFTTKSMEGGRTKTTGTKPELMLRILGFLGLAAPSEVPPNLLLAVSARPATLVRQLAWSGLAGILGGVLRYSSDFASGVGAKPKLEPPHTYESKSCTFLPGRNV